MYLMLWLHLSKLYGAFKATAILRLMSHTFYFKFFVINIKYNNKFKKI
ncbi:hypothetical protein MSIBF_A2310002 [groundwater metagenome]|uniref:Uncharacterized protein n=1 Tax=groundwater metagenome TaxID=717931 RepID=A0A098E8V3_9ZZZZ